MLLGRAGREPLPVSDCEPDEVILQQTSSSWGTKGRRLVWDGQTCARCVAEAQGQKFGPEAELLMS